MHLVAVSGQADRFFSPLNIPIVPPVNPFPGKPTRLCHAHDRMLDDAAGSVTATTGFHRILPPPPPGLRLRAGCLPTGSIA